MAIWKSLISRQTPHRHSFSPSATPEEAVRERLPCRDNVLPWTDRDIKGIAVDQDHSTIVFDIHQNVSLVQISYDYPVVMHIIYSHSTVIGDLSPGLPE